MGIHAGLPRCLVISPLQLLLNHPQKSVGYPSCFSPGINSDNTAPSRASQERQAALLFHASFPIRMHSWNSCKNSVIYRDLLHFRGEDHFASSLTMDRYSRLIRPSPERPYLSLRLLGILFPLKEVRFHLSSTGVDPSYDSIEVLHSTQSTMPGVNFHVISLSVSGLQIWYCPWKQRHYLLPTIHTEDRLHGDRNNIRRQAKLQASQLELDMVIDDVVPSEVPLLDHPIVPLRSLLTFKLTNPNSAHLLKRTGRQS